MFSAKVRNTAISVFVVLWLFLFNYESLRANYLNPFFGRELPKFKFLFPPAGWIMFYQVDQTEGRAEVFGIQGEKFEPIDPHRIFNIHWLGYDNIHRNVLVTVLNPYYASTFCAYLRRKFPNYEHFAVARVIYPSIIRYPDRRNVRILYEC